MLTRDTKTQHHRNHLRLRLPPPPRHLPRLARRGRLGGFRARGQTFPFAARQPGRPRHHLHRNHFCLGLGAVAAYGVGGGIRHRSGLWQRERHGRRGQLGHGVGLVQLHAVDHCHNWFAGHDIEYESLE